MKTFSVLFKSLALIIFLVCLLAASHIPVWADEKTPPMYPSVERGRYVARVTGCNDCHTPMYLPQNGNIPEKDWLIGSPVGWKGPWGTTYASNLRNRAAGMSEDAWVTYLKNLKARPPMPFFAVNDFNELDARSLYKFIRSLGDHPQTIPAALPPGEIPKTPYFNFDLIMPAKTKGA